MKNETEKQTRKKSAKNGLTQKHMAFRCDVENIEWLNKQPNKGRYINDLISADMKRQTGQETQAPN